MLTFPHEATRRARYAPGVDADDHPEGLRDRLSRQGEEALGKLAEELVSNPLVTGAVSRAFGAREKAVQAQEAAMGALGVPSAADVERVTRRLRSVSQRLEGIEDVMDRLDERLEGIEGAVDRLAEGLDRLDALDARLDGLGGLDKRLKGLENTVKPVKRTDDRLKRVDDRLKTVDRRLTSQGTKQTKAMTALGKQIEAVDAAAAPPRDGSGALADGARIEALEARLADLAGDLAAVRQAVAPDPEPPPRSQERLTVNDS